MANCGCNIATRLLSPGVFNLKQFLNGTEQMVWTVSNRMCGAHDLNNYDAFLVLQKGGGEIDEVALSKVLNAADESGNQTITLTWNVGSYATWLNSYCKYQIVFRGSCLSGLGVIGCATTAANGSYTIDNELADGTSRAWTNSTTNTYKITWDSTNSRWQLKNGNTLIDYQTFPQSDPCRGTWNNIAVGNNTACVWESLEAVMYISDSIAADEHVSAKCPTILRQMWDGLRQMVIKSGVVVYNVDVSAGNWTGASAPYTLQMAGIDSNIPSGASIINVKLFKSNGSPVDNIKSCFVADGNCISHIQALEKVAGRVFITVKGGNSYFLTTDIGDFSDIYQRVEELAAQIEHMPQYEVEG